MLQIFSKAHENLVGPLTRIASCRLELPQARSVCQKGQRELELALSYPVSKVVFPHRAWFWRLGGLFPPLPTLAQASQVAEPFVSGRSWQAVRVMDAG